MWFYPPRISLYFILEIALGFQDGVFVGLNLGGDGHVDELVANEDLHAADQTLVHLHESEGNRFLRVTLTEFYEMINPSRV